MLQIGLFGSFVIFLISGLVVRFLTNRNYGLIPKALIGIISSMSLSAVLLYFDTRDASFAYFTYLFACSLGLCIVIILIPLGWEKLSQRARK